MIVGLLEIFFILGSPYVVDESSNELYSDYIPHLSDFTYQKDLSKMLILSSEIQEVRELNYRCENCLPPVFSYSPYLKDIGFYNGNLENVSFGDYLLILYLMKIDTLNSDIDYFNRTNSRINFFYSLYNEEPLGSKVLYAEQFSDYIMIWRIGTNRDLIIAGEVYDVGLEPIQIVYNVKLLE